MSSNSNSAPQARLAVRQAVRGWLFDPNITMIDYGYPERDGRIVKEDPAIRFHVRRKLSGWELETAVQRGVTSGEIPQYIAGFPTDVPQGIYRLHQWSLWGGWGWRSRDPRAIRSDPILGGISISDEFHPSYGSLGGLVADRSSGAEMILSNWHVLVGDWWARPGRRIYQPGRLDGGSYSDTVATLTREAMSHNLEAAVATVVNGGRRIINDQLDLGPVRGVSRPALGMQVVKSGRGSGVTFGQITALDGVAKLNYASLDRIIRNVVTIEPRFSMEEVSAPGDSGSWWLDSASKQAIGLHFAGSNFPERALAMDMQSVLDALNVDMVTSVGTFSWPGVREFATINP